MAGLKQTKELQTMICRVKRMEQDFDEILQAWKLCPEKVESDQKLQHIIRELTQYYENGQWLRDYEADERGELPEDLKRGVLSQDLLYNLLCEIEEVLKAVKQRTEETGDMKWV